MSTPAKVGEIVRLKLDGELYRVKEAHPAEDHYIVTALDASKVDRVCARFAFHVVGAR